MFEWDIHTLQLPLRPRAEALAAEALTAGPRTGELVEASLQCLNGRGDGSGEGLTRRCGAAGVAANWMAGAGAMPV